MTFTTDQIISQQFPTVRRGYDPVAVDRFLERLAGEADDSGVLSMADIGRRRDEVLAEARMEAEQVLRTADREVAVAQAERDATLAQINDLRTELAEIAELADATGAGVGVGDGLGAIESRQHAEELLTQARADAEAILDAAARDREDLVVQAESLCLEAEAMRAEAETLRAEAAELRAAAEAEREEAQERRWDGVGDRVARILGQAEEEATDLKTQARRDADALLADTRDEARRATAEADAYVLDVRAQADDWAQGRLKAAQDDRDKAANALEASRHEAQRILSEAGATAANQLEQADAEVRRHIADLLAGARYDLDAVRTAEAEAAHTLEVLCTTARRTLDERSDRDPRPLLPTEAFLPTEAPTPDDPDTPTES